MPWDEAGAAGRQQAGAHLWRQEAEAMPQSETEAEAKQKLQSRSQSTGFLELAVAYKETSGSLSQGERSRR
jgi:hypothetical protein